jgi:hypothetical protein
MLNFVTLTVGGTPYIAKSLVIINICELVDERLYMLSRIFYLAVIS